MKSLYYVVGICYFVTISFSNTRLAQHKEKKPTTLENKLLLCTTSTTYRSRHVITTAPYHMQKVVYTSSFFHPKLFH